MAWWTWGNVAVIGFRVPQTVGPRRKRRTWMIWRNLRLGGNGEAHLIRQSEKSPDPVTSEWDQPSAAHNFHFYEFPMCCVNSIPYLSSHRSSFSILFRHQVRRVWVLSLGTSHSVFSSAFFRRKLLMHSWPVASMRWCDTLWAWALVRHLRRIFDFEDHHGGHWWVISWGYWAILGYNHDQNNLINVLAKYHNVEECWRPWKATSKKRGHHRHDAYDAHAQGLLETCELGPMVVIPRLGLEICLNCWMRRIVVNHRINQTLQQVWVQLRSSKFDSSTKHCDTCL